MMRCIKRTNIYLGDRQTAALDRAAAAEGVTRSELIRRLLDRALEGSDPDLVGDLDAIDASFGALRDVDAPRRAPGDRERHLDGVWVATA